MERGERLQDRSPLDSRTERWLRSTSSARTPAGRVGFADELGIRYRADSRADVELLVPLDGRLTRAAVGLAPNERHFVAKLHVRIDDAERQHRLLVVAVASEHRRADDLAVLVDDLVERRRGVVRQRQVDVLVVLVGAREHRREHLRDVVAVPGKRDLAAMRLVRHLLERLAADELVVELHERTVADLVRRDVVVLDVLRHEAAGERAAGLVAVRGQPLTVRLHALVGVDGGQRRRNPAGLQSVRGVRARADLPHAELLAGLDDDVADFLALLVRAPDLEAGRAGHAVTQRAHGVLADLDRAHEEELDLGHGTAVQLLDDLPGVRALDLEAVGNAVHGLALRIAGRAV